MHIHDWIVGPARTTMNNDKSMTTCTEVDLLMGGDLAPSLGAEKTSRIKFSNDHF